MSVLQQPIIRGIQAVGGVVIRYRYNSSDGLNLPNVIKMNKDGTAITNIPCGMGIDGAGTGVSLAGFRLDSEFLRANPQIASSIVIPILGGGGVALTNNNRTGTLTLNCTKVSTPSSTPGGEGSIYTPGQGSSIGVDGGVDASKDQYDAVFIAQAQQSQPGGDSVGATICINFTFCGMTTKVQFEGCTVASVDPLGLSGNDAVNYSIAWNYLNWRVEYAVADSGQQASTSESGYFIAA